MNLFHYSSVNLEVEHQRFEATDSKQYYLHSHDSYYEVCCFLEGQGVYHIEGSEYPLEPGDIVILRPKEAHYIQLFGDMPFERILLSFGKNFFGVIDPEAELYPPFFEREAGHRNLYRPADFPDLRLQQHLFGMLQSNSRFHVINCLLAFLQDLNRAFTRMPSYERRTETMEAAVIRLINDNYHLELSLQELSERFFISRAQLCRRFQKATGVSVGRYITIRRLAMAKRLLHQGRKTADVCAMCGFRDYSTFYRAYKRHFGRSPQADKQVVSHTFEFAETEQ